MPTFDFQCQKCQAVFEFSRPFGSDAKPACPECKSKRTEKLLSAPAVVFKGSGWYKTDSRPAPKKDKPVEAKSEPKTETKTDAKAEAKSEAKTEAKKESKPASAEKKSEPKKK